MKIISWNLNGIRAATRKGLDKTLEKMKADLVCFQELKAQEEQIPTLKSLENYHGYFNYALEKGYSGTAIYSKEQAINSSYALGHTQFDQEGRVAMLEFPKFVIFNLYMPHGGRFKENLEYKLSCYKKLLEVLSTIKKPIILIGDFNIAHSELDLARPKDNKNNIMFTIEERKQLGRLIDLGLVDSFRIFHAENGHYTWWPWRNDCRIRNIGWRIDYSFVNSKMANDIISANILDQIHGSDHCPIELILK